MWKLVYKWSPFYSSIYYCKLFRLLNSWFELVIYIKALENTNFKEFNDDDNEGLYEEDLQRPCWGGGEEASENDEDEWLYQTYAHDVCRNQST